MPFTSWGVVAFNGGLTVTGGLTADVMTLSSGQAGPMLTITNTTAAPSPSNVLITSAASTDSAIGLRVAADTNNRGNLQATGRLSLGPGNAATDAALARTAAGLVSVAVGSLDVTTAGQGLRVAEGSNAKQGTATLAAGTVVVANTSVTATSRIVCGLVSLGTVTVPSALGVSARTAGTSFTILASQATDTSVVWYEIIEPG